GRARPVDWLPANGPDVTPTILIIVRIVTSVAGPHDSTIRGPGATAFSCLELVVQLFVELFDKLMAHRQECGAGVHNQHETQHDGVPTCEANTNGRRRPGRH